VQVLKGKYETMTNAFRHFDKDKSGSISRQEMLEGLKRLQLPITDKQFGKIINRADADGGGSIDMNEFKSAFEMGVLAEAKRDADKQKKMGAQLMKERRESAAAAAAGPEEEVGEPDPKAEKFLWVTLQRSYSSIPEAFAFLKGRAGGKHADVLSEKELCNGCIYIHIVYIYILPWCYHEHVTIGVTLCSHHGTWSYMHIYVYVCMCVCVCMYVCIYI
jgi:hypothetical protein